MNPAQTIDSGLPSTVYYAPNFRVELEGHEVEPAVVRDILEIKVTLDIEGISSFDFNVSNWDDQYLTFKYSDTDLFNIGNRVHVLMGYADELRSMIVGEISTLSPKFPDSASPTIQITGVDGMARLKENRPGEGQSVRYDNVADWQIAQQVAQRNGLRSRVTQQGEVHEFVLQKNQDDAHFLKERAAKIDFDCFVTTDPENGDDTLYFVSPLDGRTSEPTKTYVFEWGRTLINFNPTLTLREQVPQVTVRAWNPRTKQAISYTATADDLPGSGGSGTSGPQAAQQSLGGNRQDIVVDAPVATEQEARDLAISLLRDRAYMFITGTGQCIGLPDLRPGYNLQLENLGTRFSGPYYVRKVEHVLNSSGYLCTFDVRKVYDGGTE